MGRHLAQAGRPAPEPAVLVELGDVGDGDPEDGQAGGGGPELFRQPVAASAGNAPASAGGKAS